MYIDYHFRCMYEWIDVTFATHFHDSCVAYEPFKEAAAEFNDVYQAMMQEISEIKLKVV